MAKGVIHGYFISIGYDYFINALDIWGVFSIAKKDMSAPIERMIQQAEKNNQSLILTNGNKSKSLILMNNGMVLRSALSVSIVGFFITVHCTGITPPLDVASNIVTGLAGYMGRSLLEKKKFDDESKNNEKEVDKDENIH